MTAERQQRNADRQQALDLIQRAKTTADDPDAVTIDPLVLAELIREEIEKARAFGRLERLVPNGTKLAEALKRVTSALDAPFVQPEAGFVPPALQAIEIAKRDANTILTELTHRGDLLQRYRYAGTYAGADAWDGGRDIMKRLRWAFELDGEGVLSADQCSAMQEEMTRDRS